MNFNCNKFKLSLISSIVLIPGLIFFSASVSPLQFLLHTNIGLSAFDPNAFKQEVTTTGTMVINLPIVEQNAPTLTSTPVGGYPGPVQATPSQTFTPTSTPIPVQTGSTNLPIVFGALGIIAVILIAWLFFGYLPQRSRE